MASQTFSIPSLTFPSLARSTITLGSSNPNLEDGQPYKAIANLPAARFRVYNASRQQGLVLLSDAPASVSIPTGGVGILDRARLASPMNSKRYTVQLSSDDVRSSANFHDSWTFTLSPPSSPSTGPAAPPAYRVEAPSFASANDHPYALQINTDTKAVDGSFVVSGSSTGSGTSNLVFLDADGGGFHIYNPTSHTMLAGANTTAGLNDEAVVAESFDVFLAQKEDKRFLWHLFLDEDVPLPQNYRILHTSIKSAGDKVAVSPIEAPMPAATKDCSLGSGAVIDPGEVSQTWTVAQLATNRHSYGGTTSFSIRSLAGVKAVWPLGGDVSKSWRLIGMPSPTGNGKNQWLIYNETMGMFLKYESLSQSLQLISDTSLDQLILEAFASSPSPSNTLAPLVWKLMPSSPILKSEQNQFLWNDRCLAQAQGGNMPPLLAARDQSDGSQWWNATVKVGDDGAVFYHVANFMTADRLELTKTGAVVGGSDGMTGGRMWIETDGTTAVVSLVDDADLVLAADATGNVVVKSKEPTLRWKLVSGLAKVQCPSVMPPLKAKGLSLSTWSIGAAQPATVGALGLLEDGIYTIRNESTKRIITAGGPLAPEAQSSIQLTDKANIDASLTVLWHVRRLTAYQDPVYVVRAYSTDHVVTEDSAQPLPLGSDGFRVLDKTYNATVPQQLWIIEPKTNFSFTIRSCQKPALLEDLANLTDGSQNTSLRITPTLSTLKNTQKWAFSPIAQPIASGIYRFRFTNSKLLRATLSNDASETNLAASFATVRLATRRDGLYTIEFITSAGLYFLLADDKNQVFLAQRADDTAKWKLVNTGAETVGYYVQHSVTNLVLRCTDPIQVNVVDSRGTQQPSFTPFLTATVAPKTLGSADQILIVELTPNAVPTVTNADAVPSSKIQPGMYRIQTMRKTYLTLSDLCNVHPPAIPKSEFQAIAVGPDAVPGGELDFVIQQTGNGYYTLTSPHSGLSLCTACGIAEKSTWPYAPIYPSNPSQSFTSTDNTWSDSDIIGAKPPYDATRWSLLALPSGDFNLISKTSQGFLQVDASGANVRIDVTVPFPALAAFTLLRQGDAPHAMATPLGAVPRPIVDPITLKESQQRKGAMVSREIDVEAGMFSLEVSNNASAQWGPSSRQCLTFPDSDLVARLPLGAPGSGGTLRARILRMDLEAYSLDVGLQQWKITKDDDGWYTIESYLRGGWKLGAVFDILNGKRVFKKDPPAVALVRGQGAATTQWKFVQLDGRICVVNRACDDYYLFPSGEDLRFQRLWEGVPYCWLLTRGTNAKAGLDIPSGMYSLSLGAQRSILGPSLTQIGLGVMSIPPKSVTADGSFFLTAVQASPPKISPVNSSNLSSLTSQTWSLERKPSAAPGEFNYTIMSMSTRASLINAGSSLSCGPQGSIWQLVPAGSLYAIANVTAGKQRVLIGQKKNDPVPATIKLFTVDDIANDKKGEISYLWDLTREGVFIQGAQHEALHSGLTLDASNQLVAAGFKPADAIRQVPNSRRSMWHMVFGQDAAHFKLINEFTMGFLTQTGSSSRALPGLPGVTDMYATAISSASSAKFLGFVGTVPVLNAENIGVEYSGPAVRTDTTVVKFNQWNFVPIASVLAGPLITLPKLGLAPGQVTDLAMLDEMRNAFLFDASMVRKNETQVGPYIPGVPECRFRLVSYGSVFLAVAEASRQVVSHDTKSLVDIADVKNAENWLTMSGSKIIGLADQQPKFWQILINIGDVAEKLKPWYIVLGMSKDGYPIMLSQRDGNLMGAPYDPFDANQLWKYYDWGSTIKSRVIIHSATSKYLTTDLKLISDLRIDPLTQTYAVTVAMSINWTIDVDFTLALQKAGLARHMYISNASFTPAGSIKKHLDLSNSGDVSTPFQPTLADNPTIDALGEMQDKPGCRFIAAPGTFDLSTRALIINNFVAANAPVFVHHKMTYLPTDVSEYLKQATITGPQIGQSTTPVQDEDLLDPSKKDWALTWSPPANAAMPKPVVYVRVLRSSQVMMTGFTEVEYSVFYPPIRDVHGSLVSSVHGWLKVAITLDNDTGAVDSVLFNGSKRIGNTSTSFATIIDPNDNPLCWRLTPSGARRIHVFLSNDASNPLQTSCPTLESPDLPNFSDWRTADGKPGAIDASTCYQILQADMMKSDDIRKSPSPPAWTEFKGKWSLIAQNPYGPMFPSSVQWSAQDQDLGLEAARRLAADADAKQKAADEAQNTAANFKAQINRLVNRGPGTLGKPGFIPLISEEQQYNLLKAKADVLSKAADVAGALVPKSVALSRAGWAVSASSFQPFYEPNNILNNGPNFWQTKWDPTLEHVPQTLTIDVQNIRLLNGLTYYPRPDGSGDGVVGQFSLDLSIDGRIWFSPIAAGTWKDNRTRIQTLSFDSSLARFVRLSSLAEMFGKPWASCGSINLTADPNIGKQRAALDAYTASLATDRANTQAMIQQDAGNKKTAIAQIQGTEAALASATNTLSSGENEHNSANAALTAATQHAQQAAQAVTEATANQTRVQNSYNNSMLEARRALEVASRNIFNVIAITNQRVELTRVQAQGEASVALAHNALSSAQHASQAAEAAKSAAQNAVNAAAGKIAQAQASKNNLEALLTHLKSQGAGDLVAVVDAAVYTATDPNCPLPNPTADVTKSVSDAWSKFISDPANDVPGKQCPIAVANWNFGGDPAPGFVKRLDILFRTYLKSSPVATTRVRTLSAAENSNVMLSLDVAAGDEQVELLDAQAQARDWAFARGEGDVQYALVAATYGPKDVLDIVRAKLADATAHNGGREKWPFAFSVQNGELGGDPQPNVPKQARVAFRTWRKGEGGEVEACVYKEVRANEGQMCVVG